MAQSFGASSSSSSSSPSSPSSPTLLDIYLALSHIGDARGPLAPLPGEAPEETPRLHVAHTAAGEWRVFIRPDLEPTLRQRLAALPPETLFTDHARIAAMLSQGERLHGAPDAAPDAALDESLWLGRTLLFPADLMAALEPGSLSDLARLAPGEDHYGAPIPDAARLRPAIVPAVEAPPARGSFPGEQFAALMDGLVVATCESSRESALAAEAWVRTLPAARGRGYATRVTAAWALDARRRGKIPFYSHHRANIASAGVARALRLIPFLEDVGYL